MLERPLSLVHLLAYAPRGTRAIDHFVLELARQCQARHWKIHFVFSAEPPSEYASCLKALGSDFLTVPHPLTWRGVSCLAHELRDFRPDVLQTSFYSPFEKPLLWLKSTGVVRRMVVLDHSSGRGPARGPLTPLRKLRGAMVGRIVDAIVPVSKYNARRNIERVFLPAKKVYVIPNGIDLTRFRYSPRPERPTVTLAFAGQLVRAKGVHTLLTAMREFPAVPLRIAGTGPALAALKQEAYSLPNIAFLGHIDDVPSLFSSADIVVVPSEWEEAFGLVVVEAMACGAAVIASDAGALPEVISDAGMIFKAGDAVDLGTCIRRLILDAPLRRRLATEGRARVETYYQLAPIVARHLDLAATVAG